MEEKFSNHTPTGRASHPDTGQPGCMLAAALAKKPQLLYRRIEKSGHPANVVCRECTL